jgi:pimeloyl-ACP methyl ester carboxylesterase
MATARSAPAVHRGRLLRRYPAGGRNLGRAGWCWWACPTAHGSPPPLPCAIPTCWTAGPLRRLHRHVRGRAGGTRSLPPQPRSAAERGPGARRFRPRRGQGLAGPDASDAIRPTCTPPWPRSPPATYRDALLCFTNPLERFDFSRLTMPVLMMTGEHDRLAPPAEIRAVAGRIWDSCAPPRCAVRGDRKAPGHVCNIEAPRPTTATSPTFLQGLPA